MASLLTLFLALSAAAADPAPQRLTDTEGWEQVELAGDPGEVHPLCPGAYWGLVRPVRARAVPSPVFCARSAGEQVLLGPSGYLLFPGREPKLLPAGFATMGLYFPARSEPVESVSALRSSLPEGLCTAAYGLKGDDPSCANAANVRRVAAWLRLAARLSPADTKFYVQSAPAAEAGRAAQANAVYRSAYTAVEFNKAFTRWFGDDTDVVAYVAAHELGHRWQDLRGQLLTTSNAANRAMEAEADSYAWEILRMAGYPLDAARRGQVRLLGDLQGSGGTHPLQCVRFLNAAADEDAPARREAFPSVLRAPRPRLTQGQMDAQGRAPDTAMPPPLKNR